MNKIYQPFTFFSTNVLPLWRGLGGGYLKITIPHFTATTPQPPPKGENVRLPFLLTILLLFLFSGISFSQKTISEQIDKLGNEYVKKRKNHGLVIGVIKGDETTVKSFGKMSRTDATVPDGNTVFEIGATTAVFTTSLMQVQADKNRFQQHDPVRDYIKESEKVPSFHPLKCVEVTIIPDMEDNLAPEQRRIYECMEDPMGTPECITFCDLASHVSGLPHTAKGWYKWKPLKKNKLQKEYKEGTVEDFFNRLGGLKLEHVPGTRYDYSDYGIALLGNVMSEISGLPYQKLLERELLQPLGMLDTRLSFAGDNEMHIAPGHNRKGKPAPAWNFDGMASAAGLKSTVNDLLLFVKANLKTSNKDLESAFTEVQQNKVNMWVTKSGRPTSMGYGWFTSTLNSATNQPAIWVNGGTGGFRSYIGFIKDTNTAVVVLSNSANSVDEIGFKILEILNYPVSKTAAMKQ